MSNRDDNSAPIPDGDSPGVTLRILHEDRTKNASSDFSSTLFGVADQDSAEMVQEFLRSADESQDEIGWELTLRGEKVSLLLSGGLTAEGIVMCGSPSHAALTELFDSLLERQNEHRDALKTTLEEDPLKATRPLKDDDGMLAEFSRLNNELVNTQRELARKNAVIADANVRLEALATTDGLTGLKNHREFQDSLEREYVRAARYGAHLSLLMMDVDHFKQFNDQFGHPAGDRVLMQVAGILAGENRSEAIVARYGGEEFAVVLPDCGSEAATAVAERIRRAVEAGSWDLRSVTVSIGTSTMTDGDQDRAALIARADAAMYEAKVRGRNQVCSDMDVCGSPAAVTR